jgi:hypothetical protein
MAAKYFYFRKATTAATEDDEVTGSTIYPVSSLLGVSSGTSAATGVTDDADAFTMYFQPKGKSMAHGEDEATGDNVDMVIVAITTDNNQRAVIHSILNSAETSRRSVYTVFDGGAGGASIKGHSDIEDITILHVEAAD